MAEAGDQPASFKDIDFSILELEPSDYEVTPLEEGGFHFTFPDRVIGRVITYRLGVRIFPLLKSSLRVRLTEDEPLDDYRLGGGQISCYEAVEPTGVETDKGHRHILDVSVKYPDQDDEDRLKNAVDRLLEVPEKTTS